MTTPYAPTVRRGSTLYQLPLPLMQTSEQYGQDVRSTKVPLQNGILISNMQLQAAQISFSGIICVGNPQDANRQGAVVGMVTDILVEKDNLWQYLIGQQVALTKFYRYYNSGGNTKRWYANPVCTNLQFDFTSRTGLYLPYSFSLTVPEGKEYVGT